MATVTPSPIVAQGPQGDNVAAPRTVIPIAAGMVGAAAYPSILVAGSRVPIVPPVPAPHPVMAGSKAYTSFDDWYYRIHIVPTAISLGNLSGDTTRQVLVWNAFFTNSQLEAFGLFNADGITVTQPVVAPATIGPLRSLVYSVNVSTEGPAVIDATVTWTINGIDYVVPITGRRSVLFPFRPNWRSSYMETLTWTTTVTTAWSGREQRMKIARYPRRAIQYALMARDDGARLLDAILFGWMGRFYSLPFWHEESRLRQAAPAGTAAVLVDTTRMSIADGSTIVLYRNELSYEVAEVESFTASSIQVKGVLAESWPAGVKVIPCLPAIPQMNVQSTRVVPSIAQGQMTFLVDPQSTLLRLPPTAAPMSYQGDEVYLDETDWGSTLDVPITANRRDLDMDIGTVQVARRGDYPRIGRSFRWMCRDRASADLLRDFFGRRQGRFSPVWMPSGTEDFVLAAPVDPVSPSIVVGKSQYGAMVWPNTIRRDIVIKLRDGRVFLRRIIDVAEGATTTILTLSQGFGAAFDPKDVLRVSYLGLYRLADDSVTFNWATNYVATVETDFILTEPDSEL